MITQQQFAEQGLALSREAHVLDSLHGYFTSHCARLYKSCRLFDLLERPLGDVLEIGPFFGYTPFVLRPNAASYTVLEGDDPAVYPLKALYQKHKIAAQFVDLFELFGPTHSATHTLEFGSNAFDTVLCWETMEHFNFNPVKLVREFHRVLKPGGRICITVPNKASFQTLLALASGRSERTIIDSYYQFEDYTSNGKKAFYGFHWREYSRGELRHLYGRAGFSVRECDTFVAFQAHSTTSPGRRVARALNLLLGRLMPRYGTHVYLQAEK
jgi:SAM-dependent methyltransferase